MPRGPFTQFMGGHKCVFIMKQIGFSIRLNFAIRHSGSLMQNDKPRQCIGASQVALKLKNPPSNAGDIRDVGSIPGLARSPGGVFLPGESHGQRSLVGYSPSGCKESDMTEVT